MTSHGSLGGQLNRAIQAGQLRKAMDLATEMPRVPLRAALQICFLLAEADDHRFEPAARRWLQRFSAEAHPSLHEVLIAGAALAELGERPDSEVSRETLSRLARQ